MANYVFCLNALKKRLLHARAIFIKIVACTLIVRLFLVLFAHVKQHIALLIYRQVIMQMYRDTTSRLDFKEMDGKSTYTER